MAVKLVICPKWIKYSYFCVSYLRKIYVAKLYIYSFFSEDPTYFSLF